MKGDFTRLTFRPERHYSSVRLQQGRVLLDADWNEEHDIFAHRIKTRRAMSSVFAARRCMPRDSTS